MVRAQPFSGLAETTRCDLRPKMMQPQIFPLAPNRVYRSYPGGRVLDEMARLENPRDAHFPEDWIASTTRAVNAGREEIVEGISHFEVGGESRRCDDLITESPEWFLGRDYVATFGARVAPLVKFLDSAVRLHFQCHPTIPFAQAHFGSNWGKTEAYHILQIRGDNPKPYIYLGFQNPPTRNEMRRMVLEQDMTVLEKCFEPIEVRVGHTYFVPGGLPHAIGPGILMVEVMEPTDFVARFEWEKAGVVLPESARFMGRDVEFGLDMLDFGRLPREEVRARFQPVPMPLNENRQVLLGQAHTRAFHIEKWTVRGEMNVALDSFAIGIVLSGECVVGSGEQRYSFGKYGRFFVPFAAQEIQLRAEDAELLMIFPPV
jgi:mannose-6-phosphate isomerase